jgi:hypothetical protein
MLFILLFLFVFGLLIYPKLIINIFLGISIIIPATHGSSAFKVQLLGFNFTYTDLFILILFLSLIIKGLLNHKTKINLNFNKKIVLAFIIINLIYLMIGILIYNDLSQSFYDSRVVFYYSLLLINFNVFLSKKDFNSIIYTFLISLGIYSILCITVFVSFDNHPFAIFLLEDDFLRFGRIGFHQDYLFIIAIPYVIFLIRSIKDNRKIFLYLLLSIFFLKVLIGMSRGLMFFILLNLIFCFWDTKLNPRYIKRSFFKSFTKLVAISAIFIFTIFNYFMPLIFKDESSFVLDYLSSRFTSFFNSDNSSFIANHVTNRLLMWEQGIHEIFISGLMGNGYGYTFEIDHPEWYSIELSFIDSSYVTIIIRAGFFAFILLLIIYYNQRIILKKSFSILNQSITNLLLITLYSSIPVLLIYAILNGFIVFSTSIFSLILIFSIINSFYENKAKA